MTITDREIELQKKGVFLPPKPQSGAGGPGPKTIEPQPKRMKLKREHIIQVAFRKHELFLVREKAEAWHTSLSAYIRNAALNYRKGAK